MTIPDERINAVADMIKAATYERVKGGETLRCLGVEARLALMHDKLVRLIRDGVTDAELVALATDVMLLLDVNMERRQLPNQLDLMLPHKGVPDEEIRKAFSGSSEAEED